MGKLAGQKQHRVVRNLIRVDDDADLASGLNGVRAGNAGRFVGDALQLFKTLDIVFEIFAARAGAGGRNSVRRLNEAGDHGLGFHVAVVRFNRVDDAGRFLVLLGEVYTDLDMAALDLVVDRLADIMQQAGAAGGDRIEPKLARHHAGDMRDLDRVHQHVLTIAGTVTQTAENLDEFGVDAMYAGFKRGAFAFGFDDLIDLAAGLFNHFLNAGGMDPSIHNQLFERQTRDLASYRVEGGKGDRFGGVVYDKVNTSQRFEGADVAALSANDAALHFVVGQRHNGHGRFCDMIRGAALDRGGDDLAGGLLAFILNALVDFAQLNGCVVLGFGFNGLNKHFAGLVPRHAGDTLQGGQLFVL